MKQHFRLWIRGRLALLTMMAGSVCITPGSAQFSVYYQQGAHVRLNGHEIPEIYIDGHDAEIREDRPQDNFDGGSGGLNGVEGPNSIAIISSNDPAGTDQATAYLLRFDEIFTEKYAPIPPGSHIESAWLVLDFEKDGSVPRLFRCEVPWDAATVNWNNLGSPGNGIEVGSDAQFLRDIHPPLPRIAIEVTPEIIEWYRDPDAVNGWAVLPGGSDPLRLKTNHFRDPEQILGGIPAFVPGGLWGIRVNGTALQLTDPQLLNEGAFGPPALIVYFSIPENQPPPVFDEEEPPPGGGNGGDGGGGFPSEANRLQMAGHPKKEAVIRWRDWPDRKQKLVAKNDLEEGEWTDTVPVDEVGPGRFEGREATDGRSTRFYRVQQLDEDGDGQADRNGGATNAAGERCPENVLSELFKHIERTGRRLQNADDEINRNAIVEEIRTAQLLWEFAKRYASGVYAVPFDRSVRGFLSGKKELKPILPDGRLGVGILNPQHAAQILRDTIEYLRLMFWWRLVYDNSLNDLKRQEIRNFIDDLNNRLAQLNALNPANAGFANQLRTLQQQICNLFDSARIQPESAVGELITKLMVWLAQEGITGLIKIMLADTFGKGFINGTLEGVAAAASAVMDLINGVGAFLANNQLAEARTTFNLALCKLVEDAAPLEKFQIRKNSILSFVTLHAGRVHRSIKSTMVTPLLVKFVPDESGEPGKGEWVTQPLILVDNLIGEGLEKGMTEKEFPPGEAPPAGKPKEHEVFMHIPELPDGQKAYVVVQVTRNLCNDDGSLAPPLRENYFIGVVQ